MTRVAFRGGYVVWAVISVLVSVGIFMLWYVACPEAEAEAESESESEAEAEAEAGRAEKGKERGLTEAELERLEEGRAGAGGGAECAVCFEEMVQGQTVRVLPGCRHTFHRPCADAWLRAHPACPLCRAPILPPPSQPQPQPQPHVPPPPPS